MTTTRDSNGTQERSANGGQRDNGHAQRNARVVCVDDHWLVAEWLTERLQGAGFELSASITAADELISAVDNHDAGVVIMDVSLPGGDPFAMVADLDRRRPHVRTIFLSASVTAHNVRAALEARACGYFGKSDHPDEILAGVRATARDRYAFGSSVLAVCPQLRDLVGKPRRSTTAPELSADGGIASLTAREQEVLRLLAQGLQRTAIAERLHRSPKTVDKHRAAVMRKLDIHDRAELVLYAVREGFVTP